MNSLRKRLPPRNGYILNKYGCGCDCANMQQTLKYLDLASVTQTTRANNVNRFGRVER